MKKETRLSKKWIDNLVKAAQDRQSFIKCIKIHGHKMQEKGVSDYLICHRGKYIQI